MARSVLRVIGRVRCNVAHLRRHRLGQDDAAQLLTGFIEPDERIVTFEDSAELQLQQPHVVRLETRPPNIEGKGQMTMRDLVRNCLRMRPDRIVVGEVRGGEVFDLLQAMNTGHDGSMSTLHANSPREAMTRIESMIMMGGYRAARPRPSASMISSVDRRHRPGRRLRDGIAPHHPRHRDHRHGRRRDRSRRTSSSTTSRARTITARSSAGIARPASATRAAGIAPATTARRRTSPPRSASPKRRRPSTEGAPMTSSLLLPIAAFVLAAASVGGVLFALFQPRFAGGSPLDRRVEAIAGPRVATVRVAEGTAEKARKRSVKSNAARGRRTAKGQRGPEVQAVARHTAAPGEPRLDAEEVPPGLGRCRWRAVPGLACHRRAGGRGGAGRGRRPAAAASLCRFPSPPPPRALPQPVSRRHRRHRARHQVGRAAGRLPEDRRERDVGAGKGRVQDAGRGPGARPAARRGRPAPARPDPHSRGQLLRHCHRRSEPHRRQPVGSAREPVLGAARAQEDAGQDRGDERRGQGFGRHHRLLADHRRRHPLFHQPGLCRPAVHDAHRQHRPGRHARCGWRPASS